MDIQKAFNTHFSEFVDDIANYFSDRVEIQTTANALRMIRKTNPRLIINIWHSNILSIYEKQIEDGDITFFITKEYTQDVSSMEGNEDVLKAIEKIREPIQKMPIVEQNKAMKYIQNLTKLCKLYYLNRN